jgi:outer membrane lipoprotein-sorting protein
MFLFVAVATIAVSGSAMAAHHHHHAEHPAAAPMADGAAPADTMSAHEAHVRNLHDSGYNPSSDFDSFGNVRN